MYRRIHFIPVCFILLLFPIMLNGQNNYLYKTVILPAGHIKLKAALKILSNQTGCVFSYDATKINDNQEINVSESNKLSLHKTLQWILPKDIHYNLMGKYVILHKFFEKKLTDSLLLPKPVSVLLPVGNINPSTTIELDTLPQFVITSNISTNIKPKSKSIFELELAGNDHLTTISTHVGRNNIYSIASMGYDYYGSYHLGIGAGSNLKITKHIGAEINLTQYALAAGKSVKYDIKAYTTQLCPVVYYIIGKSMKIFAGPSVYLIKSELLTGSTVTDLGRFIGYNTTFGVSINLRNALKSKVHQ